MVTLLREYGLDERWVIAVPASIGVLQVLGRLVLFFFEHRFDVHVANRLIPGLMPLGLSLLVVAPLLAPPQSRLHPFRKRRRPQHSPGRSMRSGPDLRAAPGLRFPGQAPAG